MPTTCSWQEVTKITIQLLGSNHLPALLSLSISPSARKAASEEFECIR